jgi:transcriptional regulator with XRE-family HTH domain
MITAEQCRAARGLLNWNQQDLAQFAGIGVVTIHQLEVGASRPRRATLEVIQRAFEKAGVQFIDANGGGRQAEGSQWLKGVSLDTVGLTFIKEDGFAWPFHANHEGRTSEVKPTPHWRDGCAPCP